MRRGLRHVHSLSTRPTAYPRPLTAAAAAAAAVVVEVAVPRTLNFDPEISTPPRSTDRMQMPTPPILTWVRQGAVHVVLVGVARDASLRIHRPRSTVPDAKQSSPESPQLQRASWIEPKGELPPIHSPPSCGQDPGDNAPRVLLSRRSPEEVHDASGIRGARRG